MLVGSHRRRKVITGSNVRIGEEHWRPRHVALLVIVPHGEGAEALGRNYFLQAAVVVASLEQ